jgi:hypothetical protein
MPTIEIRETIVTPDASGSVVQIRLSDAAQPDAVPATQITLAILVPASPYPLLAYLQREAMKAAAEALESLMRNWGLRYGMRIVASPYWNDSIHRPIFLS